METERANKKAGRQSKVEDKKLKTEIGKLQEKVETAGIEAGTRRENLNAEVKAEKETMNKNVEATSLVIGSNVNVVSSQLESSYLQTASDTQQVNAQRQDSINGEQAPVLH